MNFWQNVENIVNVSFPHYGLYCRGVGTGWVGGLLPPNIFSGEGANAGFVPPIVLTIIYTVSMYYCQNAVYVVYIVMCKHHFNVPGSYTY